MKAVKRWRYYCDHCNKGCGSKHHMIRHEMRCTMNPKRRCGMCDLWSGGEVGVSLADLLAIVERDLRIDLEDETYRTLSAQALASLSEAAGGCPACIHATLKQANVWADGWDFKEARNQWMSDLQAMQSVERRMTLDSFGNQL